MDSERDGSCTQGVHVKVSSKNCIKDVGNKLNSSVEDSNRNLTHYSNSKSSKGETKSTSTKHTSVSLNGPNGLLNGVDLDKYDVKCCDRSLCKQSSKNSSSRCEKCLNKNNICDCKAILTGVEVSENAFTLDCEKSLNKLVLDSIECDPSSSTGKQGAFESLTPDSISVVESDQQPDNVELSASLSSRYSESPSSIQDEIVYVSYENEHQMPDIMRLIQKDLSEPYSIYTYRYFIHKWPQLCFLAMHGNTCVGAIVCKLDIHRKVIRRGYIAMLAVDEKYRKRKIGTNLVLKAIRAMVADAADEIVLETEITNNSALRLYENLGFVRDKRLFRYYLNGVDALRLKLWLR